MLCCLEVEFLVFLRIVLPFPQFALLHSVTCVQLRLITILGNCGCVAVASFLDVPSPLEHGAYDRLCAILLFETVYSMYLQLRAMFGGHLLHP
jgi:hypothetical protein